METIIRALDLHYKYSDGTNALNGVSLEIFKGEKLAVLGENGSGKSTLFLCLNGVLKATSGEIWLGGSPIKNSKKALAESRKAVGIVFQDPDSQLFCVNVWQETAFGPYNIGARGEELASLVEEALSMCDVSDLRDKPAHFLSGGQKKRVSIASVLSMKPEAIIFDEPLGSLDTGHAKKTEAIMDKLAQNGVTIVISTHDVDMAYRWADRVIAVKGGKVAAAKPALEFFQDAGLLSSLNLETPSCLKVWGALVECGLISPRNAPPRDTGGLANEISKLGLNRGALEMHATSKTS